MCHALRNYLPKRANRPNYCQQLLDTPAIGHAWRKAGGRRDGAADFEYFFQVPVLWAYARNSFELNTNGVNCVGASLGQKPQYPSFSERYSGLRLSA